MSTGNCDWEFVVGQSVTGQWFGAARAHGHTSQQRAALRMASRLHKPWMPTELAARIAIEALVAMEG